MLFVVIGALLVFMALAGSVLKRLPVTMAMLCLAVGLGLGPAGAGRIDLDPLEDRALIGRVAEAALIVSLFTAGLKLRIPIGDPLWRPSIRLAVVAMVLTATLVAAAGLLGLGLSVGAAVLLGAVLAPTDPVRASDVEVEGPADRDRLRFTLTGEAGLNDGTAFPPVMLDLGLLGLQEIGPLGRRWLAIDVAWALPGGLAVGSLLGTAIGHLVVYLRREYRTAAGLDELLTPGLIGLAYGGALRAMANGFLAVFAAGVAVRRVERRATGETPPADAVWDLAEVAAGTEAVAAHPAKAPAYMAQAVLGFNEPLERIGQVTVVLLAGALLGGSLPSQDAVWFVPRLFLVVRPVSVALSLAGCRTRRRERALAAWFGVRGIGSIYCLMLAIGRGLPAETAAPLTSLTLTVAAASVVVHGLSVAPLMTWHRRRTGRR